MIEENFECQKSIHNVKGMLDLLSVYGDSHPLLYTRMLEYLASSKEIFALNQASFNSVLVEIDSRKIMPPSELIRLLGKSDVVGIDKISNFLLNALQKDEEEILKNNGLLQKYIAEAKRKDNELQVLKSSPTVFQASRCSHCQEPLSLPLVHFLCKHSFHQRCLNDINGKYECSVCSVKNANLKAISESQRLEVERKKNLNLILEQSSEPLKDVADSISKGILDT